MKFRIYFILYLSLKIDIRFCYGSIFIVYILFNILYILIFLLWFKERDLYYVELKIMLYDKL